MASVEVRELVKHYKVHRRPPGLGAALRSLFKRSYETVPAVEGLSFQLAAGERVGFLGPNGAGKTTTLKVMAGLLHPTSGSVTVGGHTPQKREVAFLKQIALVMGQKQQLLWDLPPADTFELNRAIYEIPHATFRETLGELTELLSLGELVTKPTRQLSLGERMRCELAAALLHRPKVLFLDEPTIGLDVSAQAAMRTFIRAYNERHGATVILTSHYMADVLALCPRVVVIDKGRLVYDGDLRALSRKMAPDKRIVAQLSAPVAADDLTRYGTVVEHTDARAVLTVTHDAVRDVVPKLLANLPIVDLTLEDPPLEEIMAKLFAGAAAERPDKGAA